MCVCVCGTGVLFEGGFCKALCAIEIKLDWLTGVLGYQVIISWN